MLQLVIIMHTNSRYTSINNEYTLPPYILYRNVEYYYTFTIL